MAQTTTHANACDVVLRVDDENGDLVNISGSANQVSMELTRTLGSLVTFEGNWDIVTACKRSGTITIGVVYSTSALEARELLEGWFFGDDSGTDSRTVQINVPNNEIGSRRYEAECVVESQSMPIDASNADPIAVTFQLRTNGPLTRSAIAT